MHIYRHAYIYIYYTFTLYILTYLLYCKLHIYHISLYSNFMRFFLPAFQSNPRLQKLPGMSSAIVSRMFHFFDPFPRLMRNLSPEYVSSPEPEYLLDQPE